MIHKVRLYIFQIESQTLYGKSGLSYGFLTIPRDVGNALIIGLIISALIGTVLPENYLGNLMGTGIKPMLVMMLVAIPMYVCVTASVPVAAALLMNGITPGAVFVFLITGPATNAASIAAVWKALGKKTALFYLLFVIVFALAFGVTIDYLFSTVELFSSSMHAGHSGLPLWAKNISAVILFCLIAVARAESLRKRK